MEIFRLGQIWSHIFFIWKSGNVGLSGKFVAYDLKVVRYNQLFEIMKLYECS